MSDFILIPLLAVHLVLVNLAMAGPLVSFILKRRQIKQADELAGHVGLQLAKTALASLGLGAVLGGGLLLVMWIDGRQHYFAAAATITPSRYWFALAELLFYAACMAAVVRTWTPRPRHVLWLGILAVLAATDLMFHFPPLFTIIATTAQRPELHGATIDRTAYYRLLADGEVLARVVHVWLASIAVAALAVSVLAMRTRSPDEKPADRDRLVAWGGKIALAATVLELPVGLWMLLAMPSGVSRRLLGDEPAATVLFGAAVVAAFFLVQQLAAMALGDVRTVSVRRAALAMSVVVLLMTATLNRAEQPPGEGIQPAVQSPETDHRAPVKSSSPVATAVGRETRPPYKNHD